MHRTADVIAVVEAGYRLESDEPAWLHAIAAAAGAALPEVRVVVTAIGAPLAAFARGVDPEGAELLLLAAASRATRREQIRWGRITTHLATGLRLRRHLAERAVAAMPEAVLSHDARVVEAHGLAADPRARVTLADAARQIERARGHARHADPDGALASWRPLAGGRWTLVDGRDGRLHAWPNAPELAEPAALSPRERQVHCCLAAGLSADRTAYTLGLTASTVQTLQHRLADKLAVVATAGR